MVKIEEFFRFIFDIVLGSAAHRRGGKRDIYCVLVWFFRSDIVFLSQIFQLSDPNTKKSSCLVIYEMTLSLDTLLLYVSHRQNFNIIILITSLP